MAPGAKQPDTGSSQEAAPVSADSTFGTACGRPWRGGRTHSSSDCVNTSADGSRASPPELPLWRATFYRSRRKRKKNIVFSGGNRPRDPAILLLVQRGCQPITLLIMTLFTLPGFDWYKPCGVFLWLAVLIRVHDQDNGRLFLSAICRSMYLVFYVYPRKFRLGSFP